jgi:hypothetical protein
VWLPLGNSFHRNDTLNSILTGGKYHNMRGMIGNSGNGNSIVSNPWMTALGFETQRRRRGLVWVLFFYFFGCKMHCFNCAEATGGGLHQFQK